MPGSWKKSRSYKAFLKERSYWRKIRKLRRQRDSSSSSDEKELPAPKASSSKASTSAAGSNGASVSLRWDNRPRNEFGHVTASESSDGEDELAIHEQLMEAMERSDSDDSHTDNVLEIIEKLDKASSKQRSSSRGQSGSDAEPSTIHVGQDAYGGE